jgi:hypothetical protein
MNKMNWVIVLSAILVIANGGLFAQQEKVKFTNLEEHLEKLMLEKNVPALGVGIIENGVLRQINMGPEINTELRERFRTVSPEGKYLFFMRHTPGQDFFWVSAEVIDELRKEVNNPTSQQ